jgi:hypothetical protein
MAIRKSTMKEQVAQAIAQAAPGDRPLATIATITGPSPWLMNALGIIGQFLVKFYFITVTDQAMVFHKLNRFTNRPQEIVFAIPRAQAQGLIGHVERNPLWSWFNLTFPGEQQPTRINVHRIWRDEMDQLISLITGAPQGVPPQQQAPYGAPAPQQGHPYGAPAPQQQAPYGASVPQQQAPYGTSVPQQQAPYGTSVPQQGNLYGNPQQGNPYAG